MLIPPQSRLGVVAPPFPHQARVIRSRIRGFILLLRVLLLCFHTAAHADKVLPAPTEPRNAPGFLESVAIDYAHSHPFNAVEGIAPVREPHATAAAGSGPEPTPLPPAPASAAVNVTPPAANFRRGNAR